MLQQAKCRALKLAAIVLAALVAFAMCATAANAQTVSGSGSDGASITIDNASKGETYSVYKLFDATVTGDAGGSIAYRGTIPGTLGEYFAEDNAGNISAKDAAMADGAMSEGLQAALKTWTEEQTAAASAESDGSALTFNNLDYGYYIVTTTQGNQAITVTSTNPTASICDKNSTDPSIPEGGLKTVDDADVSIGDTVTYTITFNTTNYDGAGEEAKQIASYIIKDTLPEFLTDVEVTSITIDSKGYTVDGVTPQFDENGAITIPWVSGDEETGYTSLYNNGAVITVEYAATINSNIAVGGADTDNGNTVTISWTHTDGTSSGETLTETETVKTYAAAIQKVDGEGNKLAGAKFTIDGLTVTGSKGVYTVVSYDPESSDPSIEMETDDRGLLVIMGIASDAVLTVNETAAPEGYNKLTASFDVKPVQTTEKVTTTTTHYDASGEETTTDADIVETVVTVNEAVADGAKEVENRTGAQLPSTGGIGTTIFYIVGGVLVAGAVVLLVTKRRMNANK